MKKLITLFIGFLLSALLSGCGGDGAGGASGMAGGGSSAGMGTSGGLPIGGGGGSMDGSMDIGALMGGLMGGGGDDDDDDDDSGSEEDDGATNTAPLAFVSLGQVGITYEGQEYPMVAASSRDRKDIIIPNFTPDVNETNIIQIAAYDIREERLHEETGSLVFSFRMADLEEKGSYPLITTVEGESGIVIIDDADEFNGKVKLTGHVEGATFYSASQDSFFSVSMQFQVTAYPAQPQQPQQ